MGVRCSETGVTGDYEPPNVVLGTDFRSYGMFLFTVTSFYLWCIAIYIQSLYKKEHIEQYINLFLPFFDAIKAGTLMITQGSI